MGGREGERGTLQTLAALQEECERRAAAIEQRFKEESLGIFSKMRNDCNAKARFVLGELHEATEILAESLDKEETAHAGLAVSRKQQAALQKELDVLKADIASEAAGAEAKQQTANEMTAEVEQLQAACAAEAQRADAAETAAKASQEEAERMRFGEADAMKKAEEALAVLTQEREAQQCRVSELRLLQAELGRQAVVVQAIREEGSDYSRRIWLNANEPMRQRLQQNTARRRQTNCDQA